MKKIHENCRYYKFFNGNGICVYNPPTGVIFPKKSDTTIIGSVDWSQMVYYPMVSEDLPICGQWRSLQSVQSE